MKGVALWSKESPDLWNGAQNLFTEALSWGENVARGGRRCRGFHGSVESQGRNPLRRTGLVEISRVRIEALSTWALPKVVPRASSGVRSSGECLVDVVA